MSQEDKNYTIALLRKMTMQEVFEVSQHCADLLAVGSPKEYAEAHCIPLRTVQHRINRGKIKTVQSGVPINLY
jgi:hypothetical protein